VRASGFTAEGAATVESNTPALSDLAVASDRMRSHPGALGLEPAAQDGLKKITNVDSEEGAGHVAA
jgi:hypothetical protein